ncbi:hypothetical protein [Caballeronia sp. J97]|uniref:hypothetical protein n=1 Tax=Caballeronia sp. J97 TaxID=2805429 RepID=UPI002AAF5D1B|nr:hypothetical protein [Caballeronia sp. J97]
MIRLFYTAVAALLLSVCLEQALAQNVARTAGIAGAASSSRYASPLTGNIERAPGPSAADR